MLKWHSVMQTICTYTHTYIHTYTHAYIYTHIHTLCKPFAHTYVHTYIHSLGWDDAEVALGYANLALFAHCMHSNRYENW